VVEKDAVEFVVFALTQTPFTEKQPEVRLIPFAKVDDAVTLVALKIAAWRPPAKVDDAVEVAVIAVTVVEPKEAEPVIESCAHGEVVPIATAPLKVDVAVDEALKAPRIERPP
jgi:hypothetical protein